MKHLWTIILSITILMGACGGEKKAEKKEQQPGYNPSVQELAARSKALEADLKEEQAKWKKEDEERIKKSLPITGLIVLEGNKVYLYPKFWISKKYRYELIAPKDGGIQLALRNLSGYFAKLKVLPTKDPNTLEVTKIVSKMEAIFPLKGTVKTSLEGGMVQKVNNVELVIDNLQLRSKLITGKRVELKVKFIGPLKAKVLEVIKSE